MSARTILVIFFLLLACMLPVYMAPAQEQEQDLLDRFEERVTEFTLDNGLRFIVIERHDAPVATFYTYADVGSVDEVKGITGLAHMFEHMAFKGTSTIGSTDYAAEQAALDQVDAAYDMLKAEQHKGLHADPDKIAELEAAFAAARDSAQTYSTPEFEEALERNGGTGLNASTANDRTDYFVSLPVNQTELWFALESERFLDPVLREFYIERDVVAEERRMRTESNPFGRLLEEFWTTAFKAHPYGEPGIGHMSDIQSYTRAEAIDFFHKFYNPANLIVAIAGDVDPDEIRTLAETYFGRLPEGARPDPVETVEPPQIGERRVVIEEQSQPIVIAGWHKGSVNHPDQAVYDILERILSDGRTSRLYRDVVEDKQIALQAQALNGFPGMNKYPHLFLIYAVINQGHTPEAFEEATYAILEDIGENGVSEEEIERAKTQARAQLVRQLQSNTGLTVLFSYHEAVTGDWSDIFTYLDKIDQVSGEDIQRVIGETFTKSNRTVAMISTTTPDMEEEMEDEEAMEDDMEEDMDEEASN